MSNVKQGINGIWTPWAEILCYKCHGASFRQFGGKEKVLKDETMDSYEQLVTADKEDYEDVTKCDRCKRDVVLDDSVAVEHNMVLDLKALGIDASMEQTGGMCSACVVERDDGHYLMTFNMDGDGDYLLGAFDDDTEFQGEVGETYDYDEMLNLILKQKDILRSGDDGK